jgi:transposase
MHTSDIYHTQGILGYHVQGTQYGGGTVLVTLEKNPKDVSQCENCRSLDVKRRQDGIRDILGVRVGTKHVYFRVPVFRIDCDNCQTHRRETIPFVGKWDRHTKAVTRTVLELRREMSIAAVAKWVNLDWRTVKEIEKRYLRVKFKRIRLRDVTTIGIDEIFIGKVYKTIVRDLESGAVLFVGTGKGGDALKQFEKRLRSSKCKIKLVAMDMSAGYAAWVARVLTKAEVVFDHFHLIKLMNDRIDNIRRRTMSTLDDETKKQLKRKRYFFLRNEEDLNPEDADTLKKIKETFDELGTAHAMKEKLRSIYRTASNAYDARLLLNGWIKAAETSEIPELKSMAKTVNSHLDGILGYWKNNKLTNAGMEGFNNKVRWLVRQAYGYHDQEYFDLKIYDLPTCITTKAL